MFGGRFSAQFPWKNERKLRFFSTKEFSFRASRKKLAKFSMIHGEKIRHSVSPPRSKLFRGFCTARCEKNDLNEMFMTLNKHYCISDHHRRHHLCMFTSFFLLPTSRRKEKKKKRKNGQRLQDDIDSLSLYDSLFHCCSMPKTTDELKRLKCV